MTINERCDKILESVMALLFISSDLQQQSKIFNESYTIQYLKDVCSVFIKAPRYAGHTTVADMIAKFMAHNAVVIVPHYDEQIESPKKFVIDNIKNIRGLYGIRAVIVDDFSLFTSKQIEKIYRECQPFTKFQKPFFFIFLG